MNKWPWKFKKQTDTEIRIKIVYKIYDLLEKRKVTKRDGLLISEMLFRGCLVMYAKTMAGREAEIVKMTLEKTKNELLKILEGKNGKPS